jgi:hypothetical protein
MGIPAMSDTVEIVVPAPPKRPTIWHLYIFQTPTIDCEPELMMKTTSLASAVEQVRADLAAAHESCPDDCCPLESIPTNVNYDKKYVDDENGAFFKLPDDPDAHDTIHIAAICAGCPIEYYVCKKGHAEEQGRDEPETN